MIDAAESHWMKCAIRGDASALAQLLERHGPAVRRVIRGEIPVELRRLLHEDDVMQEAYTDAFLDVRRFRPRAGRSFAGWLLQIARNNLIDAVRSLTADKRDARRNQQQCRSLQDRVTDLAEWLPCPGTTPSEAASRRELQRMLWTALKRLPTDYRQVLISYDLKSRPVDIVARQMGCSVGAVFMRRSRALRMLQHKLAMLSHCV